MKGLFSKFLILLMFCVAASAGSITSNYANHVYSTYKSSLEEAMKLDRALRTFVQNPSVFTQEVAKNAWKSARAPYGQSEVFRFYNGPIDMDGGPEGLLNAWPLDEAYIDYVVGSTNAGIINDTDNYPEITKELLESLNELDGEKNISTGYHAIEFLLWGQDLYVDGAGQRSFTDYVPGIGLNAQRRGEYLLVASELLLDHLTMLVDAWAPNTDNYRAEFLKLDDKVALKNILSGIIYMSGDELSGERMYVAYETMGQEDEHSCFSDMTHMDIQWNFWGVENILKATGLLNGVRTTNAALAQNVSDRVSKIKEMLAAIPQPFDQAILSETGRAQILASVEEMEALAVELVEVSEVLGAKVDF
ncbi:imelysin family protein [Bacteriovorax sp. Seq25_V]|uniref:imelysin family protein n=1 Tax=Bacteriovorax sp. Seq25_V TaxID=1201288 RepID=UPI000389E184|nr:imelysin family protein [Bacteriovorax sp. Seq25_V]EQC46061.1 imelysin [Bacteriovorax sp. Seq25_V]